MEKKFETYCDNNGINPTISEYSKFLLQHRLIRQRDLNHFMVIHHYPHFLYEKDGKKTPAINEMELHFPYGARTIWAIIEKPRKFRRDSSVDFNL